MNDIEHLNNRITNCRICPRLVEYRENVARSKKRAYLDWEYWGKPVPAFGDFYGRILAVGLAPGAHGSNRTGRMFTGDSSGVFLFSALYKNGFANQPKSYGQDDGMRINDLLISAVCRCVPPGNKPSRVEMNNCLPYLIEEIELMPNLQGFIALGRIAFENILSIYRSKGVDAPLYKFKHGAFFELGDGLPWLLASYHPSRQNTQTGRLTVSMFDNIWNSAAKTLK
jgi:uracil-DNA glycosylase family 4